MTHSYRVTLRYPDGTTGVDPVSWTPHRWGRKGRSTMPKSHRPYPPEFRQRIVERGYSGVFTMRPVASTYHFSLGNGLPASVAAIQSAMSTGGNGPRFVAGTLPTEWREP